MASRSFKVLKYSIIWIITCVVIQLMAFHVYSADFIALNHVTYYGTTDNYFTVAWNQSDTGGLPTEYEIRMRHLERDQITAIARVQHPSNSMTLSLPRSGHFVIEIRAINADGSSDWAVSTDPLSCENGISWWVYGHIAPVGPIVIQ